MRNITLPMALFLGTIVAAAGGCGGDDSGSTTATASGGAAASSSTGGKKTGGAATAGTGGSSVAGSSTGGVATGGSRTGGARTGGSRTGGAATGGRNTGGAANTGGSATGGAGGGTSDISRACGQVCGLLASTSLACAPDPCPSNCITTYDNLTGTSADCGSTYLALLDCGATKPADAWTCATYLTISIPVPPTGAAPDGCQDEFNAFRDAVIANLACLAAFGG